MHLSENAEQMVKSFENKTGQPNLQMYDTDGAGNTTIGWGLRVGRSAGDAKDGL